MQCKYIFIVMYHFQGRRNKGEKGAMAPTFYNFFTGIGFLPYKLTLLSLYVAP